MLNGDKDDDTDAMDTEVQDGDKEVVNGELAQGSDGGDADEGEGDGLGAKVDVKWVEEGLKRLRREKRM